MDGRTSCRVGTTAPTTLRASGPAMRARPDTGNPCRQDGRLSAEPFRLLLDLSETRVVEDAVQVFTRFGEPARSRLLRRRRGCGPLSVASSVKAAPCRPGITRSRPLKVGVTLATPAGADWAASPSYLRLDLAGTGVSSRGTQGSNPPIDPTSGSARCASSFLSAQQIVRGIGRAASGSRSSLAYDSSERIGGDQPV